LEWDDNKKDTKFQGKIELHPDSKTKKNCNSDTGQRFLPSFKFISPNLVALPLDLSSLQLVRRGDKGTWGKRNSKQLK